MALLQKNGVSGWLVLIFLSCILGLCILRCYAHNYNNNDNDCFDQH